MCDPPVGHSVLSPSNSLSYHTHSDVSCSYSDTHSENAKYIHNYKSALQIHNGMATSCDLSNERSDAYMYKFTLEKDVESLEQQLREELKLHAILENAIEKNVLKLSSSSGLPHQALELLSSLSMLESTVSKLEEELISLHFQLSQERNERRLAEYRWKHSSTLSGYLCSDITSKPDEMITPCPEEKDSINVDTICFQLFEDEKVCKQLQPGDVWDHPCKLSEEMVRCMKNIFISLVDYDDPSKASFLESKCTSISSHMHHSYEQSKLSSWVRSTQVDLQTDVLAVKDTCDPYRVHGKLGWADIGNYRLAIEVSWMSVGKKQLEYAAGALRRYRTLVEQLAFLNLADLSSDEKLSFWVNLYNALIMHAYLAYGVPRSDLKLFSLMQKAAYTVGGHSFSAAVIEYVLLKMKPPVHRPQIALLLALHKLKISEDQKKFAIDAFEPLVAFALSCGLYSSPAIRIYTAKNVREELQEAQRDFIRAAVGVSCKGKLLVPKMLHCFAKGLVDDEKLAVWISHYLPPDQAAFVEKCISRRRLSLLGSHNCGILPFDSRFRYLFLPDDISC